MRISVGDCAETKTIAAARRSKTTKATQRSVACRIAPRQNGPVYTPPAPANFRDWKHSRQNTGRPCVGTERHGRFLAARRAVGGRFDAFAADAAARRARRALGLAALAALRLVFEVLVGEEQLFAGGPDEGVAAVHAVQGLVLELHRYLSHSPRVSRHPDGTAGARLPGLRPPNERSIERLPDLAVRATSSPFRGAASCASAYARAPAWRGGDPPVSGRRNAS